MSWTQELTDKKKEWLTPMNWRHLQCPINMFHQRPWALERKRCPNTFEISSWNTETTLFLAYFWEKKIGNSLLPKIESCQPPTLKSLNCSYSNWCCVYCSVLEIDQICGRWMRQSCSEDISILGDLRVITFKARGFVGLRETFLWIFAAPCAPSTRTPFHSW